MPIEGILMVLVCVGNFQQLHIRIDKLNLHLVLFSTNNSIIIQYRKKVCVCKQGVMFSKLKF